MKGIFSALKQFNSKKMAPNAITKASQAISFPCLDEIDAVTSNIKQSFSKIPGYSTAFKIGEVINMEPGLNEPIYAKSNLRYFLYKSTKPLLLDYGGVLPSFEIAYETWGKLNADKSNAILIHTGLSASSHARSSDMNNTPGWWEKFIGPGSSILDTEKYFIICTNVLGSCFGSSGPPSSDPSDGLPYGTRFPLVSIQDMIRAQNRLVKDQFGIKKLYASVGSSMGGMQSLAYGQLFPDEVEKIISISACARSHPSSIALRHAQRQVLMNDPNWQRGFYYPTPDKPDSNPPYVGMRLARLIATISYRSGPEWESRFGTERLNNENPPTLCADFLVESYLDYQGSKFCFEYDANAFLYLSRAMDMFDLSLTGTQRNERRRKATLAEMQTGKIPIQELKYEPLNPQKKSKTSTTEENLSDLAAGMLPLRNKDILIIGVKSDILFPYRQQREIVDLLGNGPNIKYVELSEEQSLYGHDTFLLDTKYVGSSIGEFINN
ncbi:HCL372Cp [Eremothecium sinecaudum]|uniref:HCL372Cp n=1 Tax=Eremothecium sinecaudum TaxID=45286 RepID=A0A109UYC6_9SACH|nr:HCL372Cp [Eremothecium sinecaudum]AMD19779.1 HCL372Cp [Eremothecium sinecaudum]